MYFGPKAQNTINKLQQSCSLLIDATECTPKKASPKVVELCVINIIFMDHKLLLPALPAGQSRQNDIHAAWLFLKRTQNLVSIIHSPHKHATFSFLQQKRVADFHKNCFLSPVKNTCLIWINFFFPVRYASGLHADVKIFLKNLSNLQKFNKQILGLWGT